jgi:hypothetical protein
MSGRKITLWLIWVSFILYLLFFAPPIQPDTFQPIQTLLSGEIPTVNPIMISLFSMVGIWLLIYSCLVFADGRMQRLPAWAFMLASVATGTLGLIPYLAMREPNQTFQGRKDTWLKLLDARSTGILLTTSTMILIVFAGAGDWQAFVQEWQTNRFVNGMGIAFCLFCVLFPTLLGDDMACRQVSEPWVFWAVSLVPLLGPLVYLCLRPPLIENSSSINDRTTVDERERVPSQLR